MVEVRIKRVEPTKEHPTELTIEEDGIVHADVGVYPQGIDFVLHAVGDGPERTEKAIRVYVFITENGIRLEYGHVGVIGKIVNLKH